MSVSVKRIISLLLLWLLWVLFRTSGDYELFGFYLEGWSADSLVLNLLFPMVAFGLLVGSNDGQLRISQFAQSFRKLELASYTRITR
jgi:hypothetical protein